MRLPQLIPHDFDLKTGVYISARDVGTYILKIFQNILVYLVPGWVIFP